MHYFTVITPTTTRLLPTITRMLTSTTQTPTRTTQIATKHVHKATTHDQQQNIINVQHLSEMKTKVHPTTTKILDIKTAIQTQRQINLRQHELLQNRD